jgi:hypothetical protein
VHIQQPALATVVGQSANVIEDAHERKGSVSLGLLSKSGRLLLYGCVMRRASNDAR